MKYSFTNPTLEHQSSTCRATSRTGSHLEPRRGSVGLAGGLLLSTLLGACMPDLDSLEGPAITGGAGGSLSSCDGGCGPSGGNGGSSSGSGGSTAGTGGGGGVSGGTGGTSGAGGTGAPPPPELRHDFEASLEQWQPVGDQVPAGVLDDVSVSTDVAHSGTHSLRMAFDGSYPGQDAGPPSDTPWYGVYRLGGPPRGRNVSLWMMSTAEGVQVEVYTQIEPNFVWTPLTTVTLIADEWREITVTTSPDGAVQQWGIKTLTPLDMNGFIYLDEVSW